MNLIDLSLFILSVTVIILTPLIISCGFLFNLINFFIIKNHINNALSDFWLSKEEKLIFMQKVRRLYQINSIIENTTLNSTGTWTQKKKNGSFCCRAYPDGKGINVYHSFEPAKEAVKSELYAMSRQPIIRWKNFNGFAARSYALLFSMLFWLFLSTAVYFIFFKINLSNLIIGISEMTVNISGVIESDPIIHDNLQNFLFLAGASLVSIISFFLFLYIFRERGRKYSPKPPQVTLQNIDEF